jgi:hypothetical protein
MPRPEARLHVYAAATDPTGFEGERYIGYIDVSTRAATTASTISS